MNMPPNGDEKTYAKDEKDRLTEKMIARLCENHQAIRAVEHTAHAPSDFNALFPGTGGALYGPATHGWDATFKRSGARTHINGLYLAGGSVHPGPGVPMAALSGKQAALCVHQDLSSMS